MHGIQREKRHSNPGKEGAGVSRVVIRYADGRVMNFVPDAGRQNFHEDDVLELKKILTRAASKAEWADINTRLGF
ncbi:hypothetical protein GBA63_09465 [Rubrobacter tropicus]|uniref:Uncharacterized protein n=1 Tax=Rubrobacter tropicus TaxID=2653851 RepID=A0A6G8Q8Q3_9ACTN|nr:hypothetical protein [Rubrobacter tropicus]QIN82851.1 hypothetical protein GBA63_09465 [Rubrobacter tropicus]